MLSTSKFTVIVERVLQWLRQHLNHELELQDMPALSLPDSGNSSSSATLDVPLTTQVRKSRKRKRDNAETVPVRALKTSPVDTCKLYIAICSALRQVETHTEEASEGVQRFAAEHMKAAIKCSPERAARNLGNSLRIAKDALSSLGRNGSLEDTDVHASLILPLVSLWNLRSATTDDHTGQSSNVRLAQQVWGSILIIQ